MDTLILTPHEGIGSLKLGMSPEQILETMERELTKWKIPGTGKLQISEESENGGMTMRYQDGPIFFMIHYRDNVAVEISVDRYLNEFVKITLNQMDIFNTTVEEIVNYLKRFSHLLCDSEDELLGTNYEFKEIGIRLWREIPFHEKLLCDERYMNTMSSVVEEEYRYLFFDIVTVK